MTNKAGLLIEQLENLKESLAPQGIKIVDNVINNMYLFRNTEAENDYRSLQRLRANGLISKVYEDAENLLNNHKDLLK